MQAAVRTRSGYQSVGQASCLSPIFPLPTLGTRLKWCRAFWDLLKPSGSLSDLRVIGFRPSIRHSMFDVRCSSSGLCGKSSIPNDSTLFGGAPRRFFLFRAPNSAFRVQKNYQTNPSWIFRFACKQRGFSTKCLKPRKKRTHFPREKPIRNHIQTAVCRRPIKFS
jgi:hypothetical protein